MTYPAEIENLTFKESQRNNTEKFCSKEKIGHSQTNQIFSIQTRIWKDYK